MGRGQGSKGGESEMSVYKHFANQRGYDQWPVPDDYRRLTNFMSGVLFSTALHEENIIKARDFRFIRFFRTTDSKTDALLINFRSRNRGTIFR